MHELFLMAATEWARANIHTGIDPVDFGRRVALVYCACQSTQYHAGDEKATAAALAALSIPLEVLQRLEQVSSLLSPREHRPGVVQTDSAGA